MTESQSQSQIQNANSASQDPLDLLDGGLKILEEDEKYMHISIIKEESLFATSDKDLQRLSMYDEEERGYELYYVYNEKTHNVDGFVRDSDHKLVCFGHEYKVDLSLVAKEPDQYHPLIEVLKTRDDDVWQAFQRIKKYYDALTRRHRDA